jgi:hypothetical protein
LDGIEVVIAFNPSSAVWSEDEKIHRETPPKPELLTE